MRSNWSKIFSSCVTAMTAACCSTASVRRRFITMPVRTESRAAVGSSARMMQSLLASARAMATRDARATVTALRAWARSAFAMSAAAWASSAVCCETGPRPTSSCWRTFVSVFSLSSASAFSCHEYLHPASATTTAPGGGLPPLTTAR